MELSQKPTTIQQPAIEKPQDMQKVIDKMTKELEIQTFLAKKYKSDYEIMNQFFNASVIDVQKRNEELLDVNLKLERFAYVVAHDLKAPLRTIMSFSNLLLGHCEKNVSKEPKVFLDFIIQASEQMSNLVSDTLEYSKVDDGKIEIKSVNLNKIVEKIIGLTLAESSDIILDFESDDLPVIDANKAMMYKLFTNLIQNGLKYNKSEIKKIKISYEDSPSHHILYFIDNGIGLAGKDHKAIFEMFTRLHNPSEYEGTGIGLAMCKKIVENHDGEISVTSKENEGCVFKCSISKNLNV